MRHRLAINISFALACAVTAYFTGSLVRFVEALALVTVTNAVVYVATWKALTWWHYRGRYRLRRNLTFLRRRAGETRGRRLRETVNRPLWPTTLDP